MSALCVGLTGGVGSGKSYVTDAFARLGVPVLDADLVARDVVAPGSTALPEIAARFGAGSLLPDGTLDRRRLRELVFTDPVARRDLEAITHPHIGRRLREWRDAQTAPYCILAVPILIETSFRRLVDRVLVVDATVEQQLERLVARDRIDEPLALRMIAAQASRDERLAAADDVLDNSGPLERVPEQVAALHARYTALARGRTP